MLKLHYRSETGFEKKRGWGVWGLFFFFTVLTKVESPENLTSQLIPIPPSQMANYSSFKTFHDMKSLKSGINRLMWSQWQQISFHFKRIRNETVVAQSNWQLRMWRIIPPTHEITIGKKNSADSSPKFVDKIIWYDACTDKNYEGEQSYDPVSTSSASIPDCTKDKLTKPRCEIGSAQITND